MFADSLQKEDLLKLWGDAPVNYYAVYLPLPTTKHPPSFLSAMFGEWEKEKDKDWQSRLLGEEFQALEDQHPQLKGQMAAWKVLRVEVYPGTPDCAYDAMVVCHCDRLDCS